MLATKQFKVVHTYVLDGFHLDKAEYHGEETIALLDATTAGRVWNHMEAEAVLTGDWPGQAALDVDML